MDIISKLLDRAELLAERSQYKMLAVTLDEIDRRTEQCPMEQDQLLRYQRLDLVCDDNPSSSDNTCHKCQGSGRYILDGIDRGRCFACVGKGHQTTRDRVREKNWYARRQRQEQPAYQPEL